VITQSNHSLNWTRNVKVRPKILYPKNIMELKKAIGKKNLIAVGNQRSFGDNSINSNLVVSMKSFNKVMSFDKRKGVIEIQSGAILKNILNLIIKEGWFIPVTPGTKYVSIGGMIANNIHGKNILKNQIKYYVKEIKLLKTNKKIITCSQTKNKKIFETTIGGFGLTGFILSAKIKLKKINSIYIKQKITEFSNYSEFFNLLKKLDKYEYNVTWIDDLQLNKIKGLCYFGNHIGGISLNDEIISIKEKDIGLLNFLLLKIFTQNYYLIKITKFFFRKLKKIFYKERSNLFDFFYPQDRFLNWNKIYGKNGFFQVQFLIGEKDFINILNKISNFFIKEKVFSTFTIIKKFNEKGKYLNFYGRGLSISMDIPINSRFTKTKTFLNNLFKEFNVKINFSKDFICDRKFLKKNNEYIKFKKNLNFINRDRKLNSRFSKRLNL